MTSAADLEASEGVAPASRWRLNRAGIVNVYQYGNEVLDFAGGRLLLRGVNGSGKSTAMNMLLPFLLTTHEGRIDAAGEQSGILKSWMLNGRDDAQPVGYLWIEFERRGEFLACGCGIKANRQADSVNTWWFITSKRPGIDLDLVSGGSALSSEALRAILDGDPVFDRRRRRDYRQALEHRLFAGASIDQHIRLINKVRSPRVGDRIDLELRDYLVDALPQVSDQALTEAAQPLEDLDEHRRSVAELARTLDAVTGLLDVYRSYCLVDLSERVADGRQRLKERSARARAERDVRADATRAAQALAQLNRSVDDNGQGQRQLRREIKALERSQAYQQGQQLEDLREHVHNLARQCDTAAARVQAARRRAGEDARELDEARRRSLRDQDALNTELATATDLGGHCRLDRQPPGPVMLSHEAIGKSELTQPGALDLSIIDRSLAAAVSAVARRRADADQVDAALEAERSASRALEAAADAHRRTVASVEKAEKRLADTTRRLAEARSRWAEAIQRWAKSTTELLACAGIDGAHTRAQAADQPLSAATATADPEALRNHLYAEAEQLVDHWAATVAATETRLQQDLEAERNARALADDLASRTEPQAPRLAWQHEGDCCLADLIDFAPDLDDTERVGLEAALEASGLLSARPSTGGAFELESGELVAIAAQAVTSPSSDLLTVTVPERLTGTVDEDSVRKLLESISWDPSSDAAAVVTAQGEFRVGSLRGRHRKDRAEHVGATARRVALDRARADAQLRLEEASLAVGRTRDELTAHQDAQKSAGRHRSSLPGTEAIVGARAHVEAATVALDDATTNRDEAARAEAESERTLSRISDALHRTAANLSLPKERESLAAFKRELDESDTVLQRCGSGSEALARSVQDWRRGCDRWRAASETVEQEQFMADKARAEHADKQASLITLEDSIGTTYREVVATRDRCRAELENLETTEPKLRGQRDAAMHRKATAETEATTAAARTEQAELACEASRADLAAVIAIPGYLEAIEAGHDTEAAATTRAAAESPNSTNAVTVTTDTARAGDERSAGVNVRTVAARAAGSAGLKATLTTLEHLLNDAAHHRRSERSAPHQTGASADSVRQSLRQRRDTLGAGWDAEDFQPDTDKPLVVEVNGPLGRTTLADSVRAVAAQHQQVAGLLNRKQDDALRQLLQGMIAREIADKILEAERLVDHMNHRLATVATAHRVGVRLRWRKSREMDDTTARLVDLLSKEPDLRTDDQSAELRQGLAVRLEESRADHPELSYRQLISETLDYKQWHEMAVMVRRGSDESRLSRSTPLSEGEKKLVAYLPLFAAVAASCDALAERRAAPVDEQGGIARFVLLDDAFAKVSEDNHAALFGLLVDLDLDFIATSERLWGTHATVPEMAVTEVIRDASLRTILLEHYEWDGTTLSHETAP